MITLDWSNNDPAMMGHGAIPYDEACELFCYSVGITSPHYPVPAIREWYEFAFSLGPYNPGTDLFKPEVLLVHCYQGVFPCI